MTIKKSELQTMKEFIFILIKKINYKQLNELQDYLNYQIEGERYRRGYNELRYIKKVECDKNV